MSPAERLLHRFPPHALGPDSMTRNRYFRLSRGAFPLLVLILLRAPAVGEAPLPRADVSFSREVLPILSENCFLCHGPDAKGRKGKLRLDTEEGALRRPDPVIVPGKSAASGVIRRITT